MDTKPLERFATQARRELIAAVEAQSAAVLAAGSVARSERGETVKRLEAEIAQHGRKHVTDKVAYTWFNRLIALRYMDARGYTRAGVVSPAQGHAHGQPEILADAKRGHLDAEVVTSARTREAVMGLIEGTRRSTDAEGEAYALLLTEHCRFWNKAMPFMFEREGDYTELLVPSGLLADGAILSRAREVLTEDVCEDVEVIGWLYQFYISERKDEVFAGFKKNKKAGADEIPAATQLFTPHWIVRYLVENSLGRLWMLNCPASRLVEKMDYYIAPVEEETDFLKISSPEELTVIDPACGSGHMLTYAFDVLYTIYEEDGYAPSEIPSLILRHNLYGTEIDQRAGALAAFALTMKARAKDRRFFNKEIEPEICVIEPISFDPDEVDILVTKSGDRYAEEAFWNQFRDADTLGSLIQPDAELAIQAAELLRTLDDELFNVQTLERARQAVQQSQALSRKYAISVANPPYMGSKNMDARLAGFAKLAFPDSKADLFAMFIERCTDLVFDRGLVGMITMQSWMFLSSFEALRGKLLQNSTIETLAHLGSGAFDSIGGDVVSTAAFVFSTGSGIEKFGVYFDLTENRSETAKSKEALRLVNAPSDRAMLRTHRLLQVPGAPIAYWLSEAELSALVEGRKVNEEAAPRKGLVTLNDARFTRRWYEVASDKTCFPTDYPTVGLNRTWYPLNKGGGYRRWYGLNETLINWSDNGKELKDFIVERYGGGSYTKEIRSEEYYFLESATWGAVSSGSPSFRYTPPGFIFSSGGSSLFSNGSLLSVLGSLNSTSVSRLLQTMTPTMNFVPGDVARMPVVTSPHLDELVLSAIAVARDDWNERETSWDFSRNQLVASATGGRLRDRIDEVRRNNRQRTDELRTLQAEIDHFVSIGLGLTANDDLQAVDLRALSIDANEYFEFPDESDPDKAILKTKRLVMDLVSYAVGCMFGRYSLDGEGLVLSDQGATVSDYLAKVPSPTFMPDEDNVIPFVDDGWFEDDIVERFRQFLRESFGAEHFEENLRLVEESLGVKTIRDYFIAKSNPSGRSIARSKFYDDHVQRYKKRPIYWMFSSPKGSFNALIYLHRYTPATLSTVLNEYLREYRAKLEVALQRAEEAAAGDASAKDQKEADRLRAVLTELRDYEHDVLYPLDIQKVEIDLDDGVKVNYPRFSPALRPIKGLEASE